MVYVPAKDHKPGSRRILHDAVWAQYPRLVDPDRSIQYQPGAGIETSKILGSIPQVEHTYALWEAAYSTMNEHGLAIGESTCPSYIVSKGILDDGTAIFSIGNLIAVALERCKTARCAIETMGNLAEQYGFYSEDPGMGGGGESLTIVDREGDAWVFHITGGVYTSVMDAKWQGRRGALWAAKRVPNGHVAVVADGFIIKEIDINDKENVIAHPGLYDLTKEAGLWDGQGEFNWAKIMSPDLATFSYFPGLPPIPMYTSLRMWDVMRKVSPSSNIPPTPQVSEFPFSVPADRKVSLMEVMDLFRSHYEGTEFDMRLGALAGPFGSPNRAEGGRGQIDFPGQFARALSIPRTSYGHVSQSGKIVQPAVWFAADAPASSVYVPFFASVLSNDEGRFDVEAYGTGSSKSFKSFTNDAGGVSPAWWAFDLVANWMDLQYYNMSETVVYPKVQQLQKSVVAAAQEAINNVSDKDNQEAATVLGEFQTKLQRNVTKEWWDLAATLIVRYNDQFYNFPPNAPTEVATIGYPPFWLQQLGYDNSFDRPSWLQRSFAPPSMLPGDFTAMLAKEPGPNVLALRTDWLEGSQFTSIFTLIIASSCSCLLGYAVGYCRGIQSSSAQDRQGDSYLRLA